MNITIRYDTGRIDVFDTISFTAPQPFPQTNMLTNFELKLDDLGEKGLWLAAHYYAAAQPYREAADDGDVPVARRKMGWRFLLAQRDEVEHIQSVEMDGSLILRRAAGVLFDYMRFESIAAAVLGSQPAALYPRVLALYAFFERQRGALELDVDPDAIAGEFGFTGTMVSQIRTEWQASRNQAEETEEVRREQAEDDEDPYECEGYDQMDGEDYEDD